MQTVHSLFCKNICLFLFILMGFSATMAQETPIKILDSGELLSTYSLENAAEEKAQILAQTNEAQLKEILIYSREDSWPDGISSLDARNRNRPRMNNYVAYKVATFGDNYQFYLLRIPASKNGFQPAEMAPTRDIYFIIGKRGVQEMEGKPYYPNNQSIIEEVEAKAETEESDLKEVKILDPMELYSAYDLRKDEAAKNLLIETGELTAEQYEVLSDLVNEKSWASGISSYNNREKNRQKIKNYKAYMALEYESNGKNLMMVYIPQAENEFMPSDMRPTDERGFYMIFNRKGIEYANESDDDAPVPIKKSENNDFQASISRFSATNFSDQLNVLLEGLHNNFEDLRGEEIKEEFTLGRKYASLLPLKGATETYIYDAALSSTTEGASLVATFGDFKDVNDGINAYRILAQEVGETRFPCCTLVQNEQEDETLRSTYWLPFDINGKMHPSMAKMVMEVQLMKTLGIDSKTFKTYDNYSLVLRIYKQK